VSLSGSKIESSLSLSSECGSDSVWKVEGGIMFGVIGIDGVGVVELSESWCKYGSPAL
jgi:hypothetical protein